MRSEGWVVIPYKAGLGALFFYLLLKKQEALAAHATAELSAEVAVATFG